MVVRSSPKRPTKEPLLFGDGQIINACVAYFRKPTCIKLPILIAIRAKPLPARVMRFVGKPHGNAVAVKAPQFLDEPVVEFLFPFSLQERNHFISAMNELRSVSPVGIRSIAACNSFRIARIPIVFYEPNFQDGGLPRKWRNQTCCWFGLHTHFSS